MDQDAPVLSILDAPFVYVAFSHQANRWACGEGQDYVVKIGTSMGSSTSPRDRIEALNRGFKSKDSREGPDQPLLCATDWDALLIAFFENLSSAEDAQDDVIAIANAQFGKFDVAVGQSLHPDYTNGINDVLRFERAWMVRHIPGFAELLTKHADADAPEVLEEVEQIVCKLLRDLLITSVCADREEPTPLTYLAEGAQSANCGARLWKGGPRVDLRPISEFKIRLSDGPVEPICS